MDYGRALRVARALTGIQQQDLARLAGIDPSYISLIEQGKRTPSLRAVRKLSGALEIPVHLFTFLAMQPEDSAFLDPAELQSIGNSLTRLVLHHGQTPVQPAKKRKRTSST